MSTPLMTPSITTPANAANAPLRDIYGALEWPDIPADTHSRHSKHLRVLLDFARSFEEFTASSNRRRSNWDAHNVALYSYSLKYEAIVYQYRHSWGSRFGTNVQKSYWLAKWDRDTKTHVVEREIPAPTVHAAVRAFPDDPAGAVEYLQGHRSKPTSRHLRRAKAS